MREYKLFEFLGDIAIHGSAYRVAPAEYLYRAIIYMVAYVLNSIRDTPPRITFIICSDDFDWVKRCITKLQVLHYLENNSAINDSIQEQAPTKSEAFRFVEDLFGSNKSNQIPAGISKLLREIIESESINLEYFEHNGREVDMTVLSLCDLHIMTVGSFGWWAGMLGNLHDCFLEYHNGRQFNSRKITRIVLYYYQQTVPGSSIDSNFDYFDYFPNYLWWFPLFANPTPNGQLQNICFSWPHVCYNMIFPIIYFLYSHIA